MILSQLRANWSSLNKEDVGKWLGEAKLFLSLKFLLPREYLKNLETPRYKAKGQWDACL